MSPIAHCSFLKISMWLQEALVMWRSARNISESCRELERDFLINNYGCVQWLVEGTEPNMPPLPVEELASLHFSASIWDPKPAASATSWAIQSASGGAKHCKGTAVGSQVVITWFSLGASEHKGMPQQDRKVLTFFYIYIPFPFSWFKHTVVFHLLHQCVPIICAV